MAPFTGSEPIKMIRAYIKTNPLMRGIKTAGRGRTKVRIVKEINRRLNNKKVATSVRKEKGGKASASTSLRGAMKNALLFRLIKKTFVVTTMTPELLRLATKGDLIEMRCQALNVSVDKRKQIAESIGSNSDLQDKLKSGVISTRQLMEMTDDQLVSDKVKKQRIKTAENNMKQRVIREPLQLEKREQYQQSVYKDLMGLLDG